MLSKSDIMRIFAADDRLGGRPRHDRKEAFLLFPLSEIRQNFPEGESSHKTPRLVVYPLPAREYRYSIKAWEWTVYFRKGVWRCLG